MRAPLPVLAFVLALPCLSCSSPDPKAELEVSSIETYWVVDSAVGRTQYIAPAVRFNLRNKGSRSWDSIDATATFRRNGEEEKSWGSAFRPGGALKPGESVLVVMKADVRYYSDAPPETFFHHDLFRDVSVELFLRIHASNWTSFAKVPVERRIGTKVLDLSPSKAP